MPNEAQATKQQPKIHTESPENSAKVGILECCPKDKQYAD